MEGKAAHNNSCAATQPSGQLALPVADSPVLCMLRPLQVLPGVEAEAAQQQVAELRQWLKRQPIARRPMVKLSAKVGSVGVGGRVGGW